GVVRNYRRARSWPSDLAEGIRKALRNPGPVAIRCLLAATVGPGEGGGVFLAANPTLRLLAAVPGARPFKERSVVALARRGSAAPGAAILVPGAAVSGEWPAALVVALPQRRGALVLLARAGVSDDTRSRAKLLASVLAAIVELWLARRSGYRST